MAKNSDAIIGSKWGSFTVIGEIVPANKANGRPYAMVKCECDCGRYVDVHVNQLGRDHRQHCKFCKNQNQAIKLPTENKILSSEYCAGLFDGEGSVGIYFGTDGATRRTVSITVNHHPIIEALYNDFGGSMYYREYPKEGVRPSWTWKAGNTASYSEFLYYIQPHCWEKKTQVNAAILELEGKLSREETASLLRDLKKIEWRKNDQRND